MYIQFLIFIVITILLKEFILVERDKQDIYEKRDKQSQKYLKENVIKTRIKDMVDKSIKPSKRRKKEMLLIQAGLRTPIESFITFSVGVGLVAGIVIGVGLNNILLGVVTFVMGFLLPEQLLYILKARRTDKLEKQIEIFLQIVTKRYEGTGLMYEAIKDTTNELVGEEPIYSELEKTIAEIDISGDVEAGLKDLGQRTGNSYLSKFAGYYGSTQGRGTHESKVYTVSQGYAQLIRNKVKDRENKKEVRSMMSTVKLMMFFGVGGFVMQLRNPDYLRHIRYTTLGKTGIMIVMLIYLFTLAVIYKKINAPLGNRK